ncbi:nitrate- and nitrite sensing domain-containing protein [Streptosporangium soli]|nr:nitrate- and nitrite sensing domain-containing protein [Streptosporangium sp. KLBMP 9127]
MIDAPAFGVPGASNGSDPVPEPGDGGGAESSGGKLALKNWRVRTRLIALILLPTLAAVILGGFRVVSSVSSAVEYERVRTTAELAAGLSLLVHGLQEERDVSARFVEQGRPASGLAVLREQYDAVDGAVKEIRPKLSAILDPAGGDAFGARERSEILRMRNRIDELGSMRKIAAETALPAIPTVLMYSRTIADLLAVHDEISRGAPDDALAANASAYAALTRAKEQASRERASLAIGLASRRFTPEGLDTFIAARAQRDSELATFRAEASVAQRQFFDDTLSSQKNDRAASMRARALVLAGNDEALVRVDPDATRGGDQSRWFEASTDSIERMRKVESQVGREIITRSRMLQEAEQSGALVAAVASVILLLLVLAITALMARSLVSPLRRLRTEALSVAGRRLPETVQRLREGGDAADLGDIEPIGVSSQDEIGEVARAFDEVHREAVRLAGQEATLRSNVNSMFVNLSRRSQTLVERQLSLIENLEQGEQDEGRLGNLFRLDHLATRMRRNSENLLVLAGQEPARRWSQPVPLIDVVRASLSEVENYERVTLNIPSGPAVAGTSVNDVVHLIAELVENAISFSPSETKVTVATNRIDGGGVMVSVTDVGIGMTGDELSQANWRLANPPVVDVSVSRRMGLFVVGRLALRHGIRVQLRQQDSGGLTAMVLLPDPLLAMPGVRQPGTYDRQPVMAGPTPFDTHQPQSMFGGSPPTADPFDAHRPQNVFGGLPQPPVDPFAANRSGSFFADSVMDTPWPSHVPPPGSGPAPVPGWSERDPFRGQDSGAWSMQPSRDPLAPDLPRRPVDTAPVRRFGGQQDADMTGPLPKVHSSPAETGDDFLPIFAAVESDWFRKIEPGGRHESPAAPAVPAEQEQGRASRAEEPAQTGDITLPPRAESREWTSPGDAGWQAAQAASRPSMGGLTGSGLPKRVPKANLVPGSAAPPSRSHPAPAPRPVISPDAVRNRLASFQHGVRQGRAAARGELGDDQAYPDFTRNVEANEEDS